jgi:HD-GYP domain-containing protein (c-di-GMP phosphodiesterase class II)
MPQSEGSKSPRAVLYHGAGDLFELVRPALDAEKVEQPAEIASISDIHGIPDAPTVLLLEPRLAQGTADLSGALQLLPHSLVVVADEEIAADLPEASERIHLTLPRSANRDTILRALRAAFQHAAARLASARVERELARSHAELRELSRIGMALMTERDPDALLVQILDQAMRLTHSDAGSLYLTEGGGDVPRLLRFKLAQNDSLPDLPFSEFTLPFSTTSVAGYAATKGEPLLLADVYRLPEGAPYTFNRSFDERFGYRTKSMLVVPMIDHREEVVGVLQLINRKKDITAQITSEGAADSYVVPYGEHELQLVGSLAGQAAISIENSRLYAQIQSLFESFVKAAVTAIDQRDPTTAGHSVRVASLTVDVADAINKTQTGPFADVNFSRDQMRELRYAALLHDFGKVGVREEVLIKAKKLPPYLYERVESRFNLIRRTIEADYFRTRAELVTQKGALEPRQLEEQFQKEMAQLDELHSAVRASNEPAILAEKSAEILGELTKRTFRGPNDEQEPYLTDEEVHFLRIPKGSLDEHERKEIESHVQQTYNFLVQIPWTEDLRDLATIAYGHHEKLNGRGYPRGIAAVDIPVQTRVMTIADIFDALTASDRPYKRALPIERALDIIRMEAKDGMLDSSLVDLMVESGVYRKVLEKDWREL